MKKKGKIPVHVYLCSTPLKILKLGIPEGEKIGEFNKISDTDELRDNAKIIGDKRLCLYSPELKKIVRMYEIDDWGRIQRV